MAAIAIGAAVGGAAVSAVMTGVFTQISATLLNYGNWDDARTAFTQQTVQAMWKANPANYDAAVCYNMGYTISKENQRYDLTSVNLSLNMLHTDYDCFYMSGPDNRFTWQGDGGYINLAATYKSDKCTWDSAGSNLYCA